MAKPDDTTIANLAARQRGVVTVKQLHAAGFNDAAIKHRRRAGRLHRLRHGVHLVGHAVAPDGAAEVAALLACGRGSVVSHRSAARLWGLSSFRDGASLLRVTVVGGDPVRKPGIVIYRAQSLDARDVRRVDGMPATAPARTLLDLATVLPINGVEQAMADAQLRGLVRDGDLVELLNRSRRRRGARALRSLLELAGGGGMTRSEAERRMLALVRAAALPAPKVNARVGRFEVDFLWPEHKVIVEVDGYAFHADKRSFERDRERDATLVSRGFAVLRVTWRQLTPEHATVIARLQRHWPCAASGKATARAASTAATARTSSRCRR
jgi:very-short-patch-repair endonuclease